MNPLNHNQIEGNFTKDPEITHTRKGRSVCNFTIATDRFFRAGQETEKETSFRALTPIKVLFMFFISRIVFTLIPSDYKNKPFQAA